MNNRIKISTLLLISGLFARAWVETGSTHPSDPVWSVNSISDDQLDCNADLNNNDIINVFDIILLVESILDN